MSYIKNFSYKFKYDPNNTQNKNYNFRHKSNTRRIQQNGSSKNILVNKSTKKGDEM